jgi:hypothetical protein
MVDAEGGSGSEDDGELAEGEGDDIDDDVIGTDPYAAHFDNTTCDVIDATRKVRGYVGVYQALLNASC